MASKNPNGVPGAQEWTKQNLFMIKKGYSQAQRVEAIGSNPNGRTRADIADSLKTWIRDN